MDQNSGRKMSRRRPVLRDEAESSEINVSPLLDMVFILLIFFVVTTTFSRETGVEVTKPKSSSATQIKDEPVKIGITTEGTIFIHEKQVSEDELENILRREAARNPKAVAVIVADTKSTTGAIVKVLDICRDAGISKTSLSTEI